jgi:hypothetical protein
MSYDIYLQDESGETLELPRSFQEGGIQPLGGTNEAYLNVTSNYRRFFKQHLDESGIHWLHGKKASETEARLFKAVSELGINQHTGSYWMRSTRLLQQTSPLEKKLASMNSEQLNDPANATILAQAQEFMLVQDGGCYWAATPGNTGYALNILLEWSLVRPDGIWKVHC